MQKFNIKPQNKFAKPSTNQRKERQRRIQRKWFLQNAFADMLVASKK